MFKTGNRSLAYRDGHLYLVLNIQPSEGFGMYSTGYKPICEENMLDTIYDNGRYGMDDDIKNLFIDHYVECEKCIKHVNYFTHSEVMEVNF